MDPTMLSFAGDGQSGGWVRRFQPQRPVRPMPVVVLDVNPERVGYANTDVACELPVCAGRGSVG
jgi:hypothetical protein